LYRLKVDQTEKGAGSMKKVVLSVVAALAVSAAAPAFAADMPVKAAPAPVAAPSPFDIAFGTAFTTDYVLRGISQTDRRAAVQGYFEGDYTATPWLTLYAGLWGSNVSFADAEFDIGGGARFSYQQFGLDVGYVYYEYPDGGGINYGEFYAKPSFKVTDWLSIGGQVIGGDNFGNTGNNAWYYAGNVTVTLPQLTQLAVTTSISGDVGRQTYASALGFVDYTTWDVGVAFNYKAMTLDLRYFDTNIDSTSAAGQCLSGTGRDLCNGRFVATLKFDTTMAALK
jgi:uncharacterized protein (TIGR02001 family)